MSLNLRLKPESLKRMDFESPIAREQAANADGLVVKDLSVRFGACCGGGPQHLCTAKGDYRTHWAKWGR